MKKTIFMLMLLSMGLTMKTYAATTGVRSDSFSVRYVEMADIPSLISLYRDVAGIPGGIARTPEEITEVYVTDLVSNAMAAGLMLVAVTEDGMIVGAVSKYRPGPVSLKHTLSAGTTLTHSSMHGKGVGTALWVSFTETVRSEMPDVMRVELFVRASNGPAIGLYKKVGFIEEGRLKNRIVSVTGELEDDLVMAWFNPSFDPSTLKK